MLVFEQDGLCAVPVSCVDAARRAVPTDFHTAHDGVLYYASGEDMLPVVQVTERAMGEMFLDYVLLLRRGRRRFCVPCRRISDVVDVLRPQAMAGSRMIEGCAMDVFDIAQLCAKAFPSENKNIEPDTEGEEPKAGRILLIDDSPFFCGLLTPVLQQAGYNVDVAQDAHSALRLRDGGAEYDLIISDIEMPGMDGLSFARAVRAAGSLWRKTPLLALSAHATRHDEKRGRAAGFDDFITKFDRGRLLGALSTWGRRA
jgi:CheY-like chemotaxis protein